MIRKVTKLEKQLQEKEEELCQLRKKVNDYAKIIRGLDIRYSLGDGEYMSVRCDFFSSSAEIYNLIKEYEFVSDAQGRQDE